VPFRDQFLHPVSDWITFRATVHTLIVVDHVPEMISTGIMSLSYRHRVVGEVDIAIITEECCES
jgi:hypothetical protein